jgi:tetratricopeptide (TPR) repeat protein
MTGGGADTTSSAAAAEMTAAAPPAMASERPEDRDSGVAPEGVLLGWLRQNITALCPPAMLGVVCAGIGVELWRIAAAHLGAAERAGRLLDHLLDTGRLRSFAQLLLVEDATSEAALRRGLAELLVEPTPPALRATAQLCQPPATPAAWIGRAAELARLDAHFQQRTPVLTLSGPIGSGKSALLGRWLSERRLHEPQSIPAQGISGVFYWSFTHDPDVPSCLLAAAQYALGAPAASADAAPPPRLFCDETASERALAQLLQTLRRQKEPLLLVLDGLERFQVGAVPPSGPPTIASPLPEDSALPLGELRDPQLRTLLCELAMAGAPAILFGTVERPIPSLQSWQRGAAHLELPPLSGAEGVALLRQLGVGRGPDGDAEQRVAELGGHALTVDLLGRYLATYYQGDARAVTYAELPSEMPSGELGPILGRVVRAHLQALSDSHRQLLDLCALLPGPVRIATLTALLRAAEPERPHGDSPPPLTSVPSASFLVPPLIASKLPPLGWLQPSLQGRLAELERVGFIRVLATASGEPVVDVHPLLRTHLVAEWLHKTGGYVPRLDGDGADQSDGPGGDVPLLPKGEEALDLFEQLIGLLLRGGQSDVAFSVLCHRLGGYLHMVLHLGRPRRLLGILRRLYPVLAALAISDGRWQRRYAHLLAWETETLRILGQLDAALVTAQRQWPIGSGPLPGSLSRQARIHRLAGRLELALEVATAAQHSAVASSEVVIAALEQAAVQLLRGDAAMTLIHLRDAKARLREQPALRRQRWDGLSLGAWLQREHARRALRLADVPRARQLLERSRAAAEREGSEVDLAQLDVLLGEALRRDGQHELAAQTLHRALTFAGRSGDAEVLISGGLVQARLRLDTNHYEGAAAALGTALAMAQELGLCCHRVDLLVLRGLLSLRRNDTAAAENDARDALAYASAPGCGYLYGEADALHLLATTILTSQPAAPGPRHSEALTHLTDELELRERMADPSTTEVRWLLRRLRG